MCLSLLARCSFVVAAAAYGIAFAGPDPSRMQAIAACVEAAAARSEFSGVVRVSNGDAVVERAFGTADANGTVPVTPRTVFNTGSAGKMITALAIAKLVDRGAVLLDAQISDYLRDLPPSAVRITIAQLLNHTSGLGNYFVPQNRAAIEAARTAADLLPLALAAPPEFAPGTQRAYSNSGFVVLGAIIEKVSGQAYASFVEDEILKPLQMFDTRFDGAGSAQAMTRMSPNGRLPGPVRARLGQERASPAGGMFSTASDMARLLTSIERASLVSRRTLDLFTTPRADPSGKPGIYGYGFNVRQAPHRRVGHGGGGPGVNAEVALYPDSDWNVVALSNGDPPAASWIVDVLDDVLDAPDPGESCRTQVERGVGRSH